MNNLKRDGKMVTNANGAFVASCRDERAAGEFVAVFEDAERANARFDSMCDLLTFCKMQVEALLEYNRARFTPGELCGLQGVVHEVGKALSGEQWRVEKKGGEQWS